MTDHDAYRLAYQAALDADAAWQAKLVERYGSAKAPDARYDTRGRSTPTLKRLYRAKRDADDNLRALVEETR
jgi:hypothetical protein